MGNCTFVVAIITVTRNANESHFSVDLENGEHIYFIENNFQEGLYFPLKMILIAFLISV